MGLIGQFNKTTLDKMEKICYNYLYVSTNWEALLIYTVKAKKPDSMTFQINGEYFFMRLFIK